MEIRIRKIETVDHAGFASGEIRTYRITGGGPEFVITRKPYPVLGRISVLAGKEGRLVIDGADHTVRRLVVAPGGGCGLRIDDEPVDGLSPWALRAVIFADDRDESREIRITIHGTMGDGARPLVLIDGEAQDLDA